jgi:hypothetical protein
MFHRIDQSLFVLETKQNYYQAQAIEAEVEWVFFYLHDFDPVPGQYERYFKVCDGDESRFYIPEDHFCF